MASSEGRARRAAVVGSPVDHSLSPVLHRAAFTALGLDGWSYERVECDATGLPGLVAGLGPEWVGLSVTMPGKHAALALAAEVSARARTVGAANTLVHAGAGWAADCTDVDGVTGALRAAAGFGGGDTGLVLGGGGSAAAALVGLAELGLHEVTLAVREPARAENAASSGERAGLRMHLRRLDALDLDAAADAADVVVSTLPAGAADEYAPALARSAHVLDVLYHPWPTPLAAAVRRAGGGLATGLDMLLHQAFGQVQQFTGRPAPCREMYEALLAATGGDGLTRPETPPAGSR